MVEGSGNVFDGFYPSDAIDAGDLIRCADNAMHHTKEQGLDISSTGPIWETCRRRALRAPCKWWISVSRNSTST